MHGYHARIEQETTDNTYFRRVLYTGKNMQLVVMAIAPGEEIGVEVHPDNDQFLRFEAGTGRVIIDDTTYDVVDGDAVIVPAGARHNVMNTSLDTPLKLYTLYAPPHHRDGTVHQTKADAASSDEDFDGGTTE